MSILTVMNVVSLVIVIGVAGEALRRMRGHHEPFRAFVLCAVAVGAFGEVCFTIEHGVPSTWSVVLHIGVALYAALHHRAEIHRITRFPHRIH